MTSDGGDAMSGPDSTHPEFTVPSDYEVRWYRRIALVAIVSILMSGLFFVVLGIGAVYHDAELSSNFEQVQTGTTAAVVVDLLGDPDRSVNAEGADGGDTRQWFFRSKAPFMSPSIFVVELRDERVVRTWTE